MTQKRNNNLDLLRIICMLMIVSLHFYNHGGLINHALSPYTANWYIGNLCYALCFVAVNCMVLITGYFQCTSRFKLKRLLSVWVQAVCYSFVLFLISARLSNSFSVATMIKSLMVLTMKRYWYVSAYLLLYAVSPFLNCAIHTMTKKLHLLCCGVLICLFSMLSNIVYVSDFANILGGSSFLWFCVLYVIAAYIRLHVPVNSNHFKPALAVYFVCASLIAVERYAAYLITPLIFGRVVLASLFFSYNSILTTSASIALFLALRATHISSPRLDRVIRFFAPLTFGVYLIHDHPGIRPLLWNFLSPGSTADSNYMLLYGLLCACGIYLSCCLIEWIRQHLFRICRINLLIESVCNRIQNRCEQWLSDPDRTPKETDYA